MSIGARGVTGTACYSLLAMVFLVWVGDPMKADLAGGVAMAIGSAATLLVSDKVETGTAAQP